MKAHMTLQELQTAQIWKLFMTLKTISTVVSRKHEKGHEVPGVVAALFSKVAGSKYTCKRLRVYEATKKKCEQPLVRG